MQLKTAVVTFLPLHILTKTTSHICGHSTVYIELYLATAAIQLNAPTSSLDPNTLSNHNLFSSYTTPKARGNSVVAKLILSQQNCLPL